MKDNKQYKILSIHWGFSLGGVAKYAELLEQVGQYRNIKINSICIHGENWGLDTKTMSSLDLESIIINSRLDLSWIKKLKAYIEQEKPDAIITHGFNGHLVYWWASLFSTKKILWLASYHGEYHGNSAIRRVAGKIFNHLTIWLFKKRVNRVVSVASYSKKHLIQHGVNPNKVDVIHNGIPMMGVNHQAGKALREEWNIKDDEIIFGVVSRLDPVKGIEYLIEAFEKISPKFPNVKFIVIGSGSITDSLKSMVERKGLTDVTQFVGYRSDVINCLAALDIFVLPSLAEYHSIALLEAMRSEKTIISTDVGGNTESVRDGEEAIVVPSADATALSEALARLLADPALRDTLAKNARRRFVNEFTSDIMIKQTANWLFESLENNKASS